MIFFKYSSAISFVSPYEHISRAGHHEVKHLAAFFVSIGREKVTISDVFILYLQN